MNKSSKNAENTHKQDKKGRLKELILRSGLPLEIEISSFLANQRESLGDENWDIDVSTGAYYVDKDEGKGRELDIKANIPIVSDLEGVPDIIFLDLLVQCKNIPGNAWVFFKSPYSIYPSCKATCILDAISWIPRSHVGYVHQKDLHFHKAPLTTAYDEYVLNPNVSNNRSDNLFGAVISLAKATSYEIDMQSTDLKKLLSESKFFDYIVIYYPILVFNGEMYLAENIEKGKNMKLTPTNHVGLYFDYTSGRYDIDLVVDVVHRTEFKNFFQKILSDIDILKKAMGGKVGAEYRGEISKARERYLGKKRPQSSPPFLFG